MSQQMTPDEQIGALVRAGVPREKAERRVRGEQRKTMAVAPVIGAPLSFPIRFTLPWSALVSENRRFCARESRIVMTAEYKAARDKVSAIARDAMTVDGYVHSALECPLSLVARVWFPDKRVHDAPNFAGATHNGLKRIVFTDDSWLHRATWERAGVDVDRPRADVEIAPL